MSNRSPTSRRLRPLCSPQRVCFGLVFGGFFLFFVFSERAVLRKLVRVSSSRSVVGIEQVSEDGVPTLVNNNTTLQFSKENITAGCIHIGKTGGSTLTGVIRNSCHSFMRESNGQCRNSKGPIPNETAASELVTAYYHGTY